MDVISGYHSTLDKQEDGELFYAPCFVKNKHLYMLNSEHKTVQLGIPASWLGDNLVVIKERPKRTIS